MIEAILNYRFLQYAIIAALLSSIVCGLIGVIIVEKKLVMMSGGIAHTSYGGVGLGYLLGFEPILGAFIFSILAALGIGFIKNKSTGFSDVVIGLFWSLGMSLGILFIGLMPGYPPNVTTYLFGNILSVTSFDLILMVILTVVVLLVITIFYQDWKAHLFDQEFTKILGKKTKLLENALLILIALTVVVLIRVVGIVLVIALLTAPAATASLITKKLSLRMTYSIGFGLIFSLVGLWISYVVDIASGAVIVFFSILCYVSVYLIVRMIKKRKSILSLKEGLQ
ncbi:MAG: metal ABC transporter permease [Candidatus Izemoplasmatales bacterium]|jgi:zinc transport system permease protein|nr:metal ABC transporter permease [Candidatus Izemoplasmatales bacterium]